jgi:hypothetical protein
VLRELAGAQVLLCHVVAAAVVARQPDLTQFLLVVAEGHGSRTRSIAASRARYAAEAMRLACRMVLAPEGSSNAAHHRRAS